MPKRLSTSAKAASKYNYDCSIKGVARNFKELKPMTDISHTISTGNKFVDRNIARYAAKTASSFAKDPRTKVIIKAAEKAYPHIENVAANIARAQAAYSLSCKRKK